MSSRIRVEASVTYIEKFVPQPGRPTRQLDSISICTKVAILLAIRRSDPRQASMLPQSPRDALLTFFTGKTNLRASVHPWKGRPVRILKSSPPSQPPLCFPSPHPLLRGPRQLLTFGLILGTARPRDFFSTRVICRIVSFCFCFTLGAAGATCVFGYQYMCVCVCVCVLRPSVTRYTHTDRHREGMTMKHSSDWGKETTVTPLVEHFSFSKCAHVSVYLESCRLCLLRLLFKSF